MTSEQKEREAFEAANGKGYDYSLKPDAWGRPIYVITHIEAMFNGWQLAKRHQAQPEGELVERLKHIREYIHTYCVITHPKARNNGEDPEDYIKAHLDDAIDALSVLPPQPAQSEKLNTTPDKNWNFYRDGLPMRDLVHRKPIATTDLIREQFKSIGTVNIPTRNKMGLPPAKQAVTNADLIHHSALHAYLGYTDSFKAGDVVTQGYIDRLHNHYLPNLMAAIEYRKPAEQAGGLTEEL